MDTRQLGRTGLKVPALGLGCVKLGRNRDVKYPEGFQLPSDGEVTTLLDCARELGVNLLDTAPAYGRSEERLGTHVAASRNDWIVCTKAGEDHDDRGSHFDFRGEAIARSVDRSLRRLHTDHVDILLLHSDGRDREHISSEDTMEALRGTKRAGKALAIGVSVKTIEGIEAAVEAEVDVIMAPLSHTLPELGDALAEAHRAGCGILAIKGLGQGHAVTTTEDRARALEHAIRFVLERPFVDCLVVGTRSAEHLRQAAAVAEGVLRGKTGS